MTLARHAAGVQELILFSPVYFFISLIDLRNKLFVTPSWFDGTLSDLHQQLLQFAYTNNEQSRLLQFLIPESLSRLFGMSIEDAYSLQRWLFIFVTLVWFHMYLRKWFSRPAAFAGVLFLAAAISLTFQNDLQESSPLLLLTFLVGLWSIRDNNLPAMAISFLIGGLNNETMLILPLAYLFYNYKSPSLNHLVTLVRSTVLVSLPLVVPVAIIRIINRDRPHLGPAWQLPNNIDGLLNADLTHVYSANYVFFIIIFGIFWLYAFIRYRDEPLFLRRASLIIPFFLLAHLLTGVISEVRQMLPLGFIIIPMALYFLLPAARAKEAPAIESTVLGS